MQPFGQTERLPVSQRYFHRECFAMRSIKEMKQVSGGIMEDKQAEQSFVRTRSIHKRLKRNTKNRRGIKTGILCIICFTFFCSLILQTVSGRAETKNEQQAEEKTIVTFSELNDKEVFLKQSQAHVCTLTASAMMVRRAAMLSGNKDWKQITEQSVRKYAWTEKTGLKWNFTAAGITVTHKLLSSKSELIRLLDKHPEGVVIYNSRQPHAILVTDYTDGILYCSDPSNDKPSGRYPIGQASITAESASRCWYVKKPVDLKVVKEDADQLFDQTAGDLTYRILDEQAKTVICTGLASADSTVVTVPDKVTINGTEYQVVQIAEGAFANSENLKELTIEANVAAIEQKAFYQCKKLKKVTIHANKLQKIGTDAFAQIHKKAQILIVGEQMETFAALLTGTSVPVTATVDAKPGSSMEAS